MKKFDFDKKLVQIAILSIIVIFITILFEKILGNVDNIYKSIVNTFDFIEVLFKPFLIAFAIAYFLNPAVRYIENNKYVKNNSFFSVGKRKRYLSVAITYVIALFAIYLIIATILPSVVTNVNTLIATFPSSINEIKKLLIDYSSQENNIITPLLESFSQVSNQEFSANHLVNTVLKNMSEAIFNIPNMFSSLVFGVVSLANGVLAFILGFVISIYMVFDKEYFKSQVKKIIYVLFKRKTATKIIDISNLANITFEKFIVGKATDSFIIGTMFFILSVLFKVPYAPLFGLVIGVTNMIPYFGPFIGAVPVLIITLAWDYHMFIPIGITILVLQQFDGIILGPKILGDSIGLKPISIIFAIIIGGGLFGVIGMFLGVPVYAVISTIVNSAIDKNYSKYDKG